MRNLSYYGLMIQMILLCMLTGCGQSGPLFYPPPPTNSEHTPSPFASGAKAF